MPGLGCPRGYSPSVSRFSMSIYSKADRGRGEERVNDVALISFLLSN